MNSLRAIAGRRIVLGITGGIAAYKSAALARLLTQQGAEVDVIMTRAAQNFVGATTLQALTGRTVRSDIFAPNSALDHVKLAAEADLIVVAPATADFLARTAAGRADDLLSATVLAARSGVLVAPAMNDRMWSKPATQRSVRQLVQDGMLLVEPEVGPLAAGEGEGRGRMAEPETILAHIARALTRPGALAGRKVIVSAGATREPVDPVRFLSNRSSGRMGVAIAAAAWMRHADVVLVAGAMSVAAPVGVRVVHAETTSDMLHAVRSELAGASALVMAAAPADFSPSTPAGQKLKKDKAPESIDLSNTPDILRSTQADRPDGCIVVGFALETENPIEAARRKLSEKQLDLIVLNDATEEGAGFEVDTNKVLLLRRDGSETDLPLQSKSAVAEAIIDEVEMLLDQQR